MVAMLGGAIVVARCVAQSRGTLEPGDPATFEHAAAYNLAGKTADPHQFVVLKSNLQAKAAIGLAVRRVASLPRYARCVVDFETPTAFCIRFAKVVDCRHILGDLTRAIVPAAKVGAVVGCVKGASLRWVGEILIHCRQCRAVRK